MAEIKANPLVDIKYVTIHHSAVSPGASNLTTLRQRANSYEATHKNKAVANNWPSKTNGEHGYYWISYHYLVARDGAILQTQDIKHQRIHATDTGRGSTSHNIHGVAICLDGNFQTETYNSSQLNAVIDIVYSLEKYLNRSLIVRGHKQTALLATACPGLNLGDNTNGFIKKVIDGVNARHEVDRQPKPIEPPIISDPGPVLLPPKPIEVSPLPYEPPPSNTEPVKPPMIETILDKYLKNFNSKKLFILLFTIILIIWNSGGVESLTQEEIEKIVLLSGGYLGVQGGVDIVKQIFRILKK